MPPMLFAPILDLCVTHPYYDDGRSNDFTIEPTARTVSRLAGLKLFWKQRAGQLSVFAGLNGQGRPIIPLSSAETLGFVLRLRGRDFRSFTDLDSFDALPAPLFTDGGTDGGPDGGTGSANPLALRLTTRTATRQVASTVMLPGPGEGFLLSDPPLARTGTADIGIEPAGAVGEVKSVDAAGKRVTIDTSKAATGTPFTITYPVAPGRGRDVLAEVRLTIDDTLLRSSLESGAPRVFQVPFAAAAARWCFYLVTDRADATDTFVIVEATPGDEPRRVVFSDAGRADLTRQPDAADQVATDLQRRNPGKRILRFLSDGRVACRKTTIKNLELQVGGSRLFASLPNPSPGRSTLLPAADPGADQPATVFYEAVTLVTN
jgi:hypothetical protein